MPKVRTKSLRSLVSKCNPSILTGAITESADYIDELETEIERLKSFTENLQVVHFTEPQREKATVERYEKALKEIAESNEDTPFARHIILHARRTLKELFVNGG